MNLELIKQDIDEKLALVNGVTEDLKAERFETWSDDRQVWAVVDGHGGLERLSIAEGALHGPHPARIGATLVQTIKDARSLAAAENRRRFAEVIPTMFPDGEES